MQGIYCELRHGQEGVSCDGMLRFTVYGETLAEATSWAEAQAWAYVHHERPTTRTLKSRQVAPVAPYLITMEGRVPLDFPAMREVHDALRYEDMRGFGCHSSGRIGSSRKAADEPPPEEVKLPESLEELRAKLEDLHPPDSDYRRLRLQEDNWDPKRQAFYTFVVDGETPGEWSEVVFCRAVNFHHAASLWVRDGHAAGLMRTACFSVASMFCAAGETLAVNIPPGQRHVKRWGFPR
jgi:hypothetical protein